MLRVFARLRSSSLVFASVNLLAVGTNAQIPPVYIDYFEPPFQHENNDSTHVWSGADWLEDADKLGGELEERFHALHLCLIPVGPYRGRVLGWNYAADQDPNNGGGVNPLGATFWSIINPETAPQPGSFLNFRLNLPPDAQGNKRDLACAGHTWLPDGRLLVAGGTSKYAIPAHPTVSGAVLQYVFDPTATPPTWTRVQDLIKKRWYPTATLATDPLVLISGGEVDGSIVIGDSYEAVRPNSVPPFLPNLQPGPGGSAQLWGYPRMHLLSDGQVFASTMWIDAMPSASSIEHHLQPGVWTIKSSFAHTRQYGTSVLFPNIDAKHTDAVMIMGGVGLINGQATVSASVQLCKAISDDMSRGFCDVPQGNQWTPVYTGPIPPECAVPNMHYPRQYLNSVLLPDASVLVVGGLHSTPDFHVANAVKQVEIFRGGTWETGAIMDTNRSYHSTALLLPSGKVLVAAGEQRTWDYEIYVPRYLVWGKPKPVWSTGGPPWQENVNYGNTYQADFTLTGTGGALSKVVLMRPGSVTHHSCQDQRYVRLATSVSGNTVTFTMPPNSNEAPKGFYMVFLVTSDGTPSVARWIKLQ